VLTQFPHQNLLKALDYFVSGEGKLHLVYELHATSLWDMWRARAAGNTPESPQAYCRQVHDLVAALTHLHSIGICHGDVTLKNCLLTHSGMLRLADYGTAHSAHGFLLRREDELTTLYARAPERFLGVAASTTAIDMWAVGVVSFLLASGDCPWICLESGPRILGQLEKLLGPITADSWPDHDRLPLWHEMKSRLRQGPLRSPLQSLAEEGRRAQEGEWLVPVIEVAHRCMKWCPEHRPSSRSLLASMQSVRLGSPITVSAPGKSQEARPSASPSAAREPAARDAHPDDAGDGHCQCSGNCGVPACKKMLNLRNRYRDDSAAPQRICQRSCLPGFNFCTLCQCEAMENDIQCRRGRMARSGKRFCFPHGGQFQISDQQ
jgi:serine/threonine protein kinase